jgi:hypothetical protein
MNLEVTGGSLPLGTENQTVRYNSSNELEATDTVEIVELGGPSYAKYQEVNAGIRAYPPTGETALEVKPATGCIAQFIDGSDALRLSYFNYQEQLQILNPAGVTTPILQIFKNQSDVIAEFDFTGMLALYSNPKIDIANAAQYKVLTAQDDSGNSDWNEVKIKCSSSDPIPGYLLDNVVAVSPITITEIFDGDTGKEQLQFGLSGTLAAILSTHVDISYTEFRALNATPKTIFAAPGANSVIEVISANLYMDYNATAYSCGGNSWKIRYIGNTSYPFYISDYGDAYDGMTEDRDILFSHNEAFGSNINKGIELYSDSASTLGDSPFKLFITYRIIDLTV